MEETSTQPTIHSANERLKLSQRPCFARLSQIFGASKPPLFDASHAAMGPWGRIVFQWNLIWWPRPFLYLIQARVAEAAQISGALRFARCARNRPCSCGVRAVVFGHVNSKHATVEYSRPRTWTHIRQQSHDSRESSAGCGEGFLVPSPKRSGLQDWLM